MGCPSSSNIAPSVLLRLEESEARGSPVFLCRLYTRLPRIGSGRDHSGCPKSVSICAGGLPSTSLKHTRIKVHSTSALTTTIPFGLRDRALRVAPQVRLKVLRVLSIPHQLRYKGNASPMRLQRRRELNPALDPSTTIEAQSTHLCHHTVGGIQPGVA